MALYKVTLTDNGIERLGDEDHYSLNISAHRCVKHNGQITSSEKLSLGNGAGLCWTVITRRIVIIKYNASSFDLTTLSKIPFGYIYKTAAGQVKLGFAINAQQKRALCTGAHFTSTDQSTDGNPGVAIGVSVATATVFIVLACVFIILKRRKKLPNLCSKAMLTNESHSTQPEIELSTKTVHCSHVKPSYDVFDKTCMQSVGNQDNTNDSKHYAVLEGHVVTLINKFITTKRPVMIQTITLFLRNVI
ncbi:uncharacterized protein LOC123559458 [Mercenaria mercenaria]|uniref:uncharacterized protein LOC123559458 n=1 Tax=Mercenaria mercenaria TaxID=6596 RepID=UPI00234E7C49|nr:uncharacterized protein LOC123559458 [Mercenaria mercenaria]